MKKKYDYKRLAKDIYNELDDYSSTTRNFHTFKEEIQHNRELREYYLHYLWNIGGANATLSEEIDIGVRPYLDIYWGNQNSRFFDTEE